MSYPDPFVDEVRRIREAFAAKFNYDFEAMFRHIKEREKSSGRVYVSFSDEKVEPIQEPKPNETSCPEIS